MECKRLEKKIRDWAIGLGFRLPDGSAPPSNYFALLTVTPHRRQLWEALVEAIQSRKKIEHARKQILVSKLKEASVKGKQRTGRIELWERQNSLEVQIKEKKTLVNKVERCIITRASDLLFEICKLAELEKQCEEYKEKVLVLKLVTKRKKKLLEELEALLLKVVRAESREDFLKSSEKEKWKCFLDAEECKILEDHDCGVISKLTELTVSGISEECLWEEIIRCKKNNLEKFSNFLQELNLDEKNDLREKEQVIKKSLSAAMTHLKQRITEKSLEVIVNEVEGKLLDGEVEKLQGRLEALVFKSALDGSLDKTNSFLCASEMSEFYTGKEERLVKLRNYVTNLGLESYREILANELRRLEEGQGKKMEAKEKEKEFQETLKSFDSVVEEINISEFEEKELEKEIASRHEKLQWLVRCAREETPRTDLEETANKLKVGSERQMELFVGAPLDAFRTVDTPSGRKVFECESISHFLNSYGGELKQFFSGMLLPPGGDVESILSELRNRRKCTEMLKKFAEERGRLSETQKTLETRLTSIKGDSQLCEANFKDSDEILWNIFFKAEELTRSIEFIEKILRNWVEQPYRLMIRETETVNGKTLREYEEGYRRARAE